VQQPVQAAGASKLQPPAAKVFFRKPVYISHIVLMVYIPTLTKIPLRKMKITTKSLQASPTRRRRPDSLVAADHPPDEDTHILNGTQSSTPATPMRILLANVQA
jgi:hypothetical protein